MTEEEINTLKAAKNESEWNDACDALKKAHNGYPADWYEKVLASGLLNRVRMSW